MGRITGATGCGKSFIASAIGQQSCRNDFRVKYLHLPSQLEQLDIGLGSNDSFAKIRSELINGFDLILSCNELAIMEVLQMVPTMQDFTEAVQLMEGLAYMRASKVQLLLERSNSIKARRLYLYLGNKFNHDWANKIDRSKIDLGSGKRMLIKGGIYDPNFQITVPEIEEQ